MKKLFVLVFLMSLLFGGVAYAEISAQAYTGNSLIETKEQQVYIMAYNNSGDKVPSGSVVIIDTSAITTTDQASNAVGTYFTSTTTADDERVLGVALDNISKGAVGRICVRGPAEINLVGDSTRTNEFSAGATIGTSSTALYGTTAGSTDANTAPGYVIGTLLGPSMADPTISYSNTLNGTSIWWVWVGKE